MSSLRREHSSRNEVSNSRSPSSMIGAFNLDNFCIYSFTEFAAALVECLVEVRREMHGEAGS